jgi:hypothetical protein
MLSRDTFTRVFPTRSASVAPFLASLKIDSNLGGCEQAQREEAPAASANRLIIIRVDLGSDCDCLRFYLSNNRIRKTP